MRRLHVNTPQMIAILVAATTVLTLWGTANSLVRGALIVLLLVLLGLVLMAALFPGQKLGGAERILYVLVSSIAVITLAGLVSNVTPWGLDGLAWTALLAAVAACAGLVAWKRRQPGKKPVIERIDSLQPLNLAQASLFGLSAVIMVLALTVARVPAAASNYQGYSMLSILPMSEANATTWQISVDSKEFAPTTYFLTVSLDDQIVYLSPNFTLGPHQQWQTAVDLSSYELADGQLEARLYRSDDPGAVYRQVLVRQALRIGGN